MERCLKNLCVVVAIAAMFPGGVAIAGQTGHYVSGVEGIKAASIPGPGLYYKMYNAFYKADTLTDSGGDELDVDFDVAVFASAHRFIWVTPLKILGADFIMDATIPLVYSDLEIGAAGVDDSQFGLGDICVEPFALSWHGARYDAVIGLAGYVPVGQYDEDDPASPGKDFWTAMFTFGGTLFLDEAKTWSASILGRYEIHSDKSSSDVKPGDDFHFEWGVGKTLAKVWDVGVAGYCRWQVKDDSGSEATWDKSDRDRVFAMGPEISAFIPSWKTGVSLRHEWEFDAVDRSEGHVTVLTMTKVF